MEGKKGWQAKALVFVGLGGQVLGTMQHGWANVPELGNRLKEQRRGPTNQGRQDLPAASFETIATGRGCDRRDTQNRYLMDEWRQVENLGWLEPRKGTYSTSSKEAM